MCQALHTFVYMTKLNYKLRPNSLRFIIHYRAKEKWQEKKTEKGNTQKVIKTGVHRTDHEQEEKL